MAKTKNTELQVTSSELQDSNAETTSAVPAENTEVKVDETITEEKTDTPTPEEKTEEVIENVVSPEPVETAKRLMKENDVKEIYRTNDSYWFTKPDLAKQHQVKVGGEVETFNVE